MKIISTKTKTTFYLKTMFKAAIKREESDARISFSEREQARNEVSRLNAQCSIKTGLYGGSFNPIHNGHIQLSKALLDTHLVDEMWLLVSPQNPFKVNQKLLDDNIRLRLAKLAVKNIPGLIVSDYEFHLPRPSYMFHTLEHLRQDFPEREFILIIGADNWERFPMWYKSEEILALHRVIVYPRSGCELKNIPEGVTVADTPIIDISSTEIRKNISNPDYHGEGLPPVVWKEIKQKGYYKASESEE